MTPLTPEAGWLARRRASKKTSAAILAMRREGPRFLISEPNLSFARGVVERIYVIEKGSIRFAGAMDEFDARPDVRGAYLAL
jgi:branched-chain amino acid transport system ATP-binding protein